MSTRHTASKPFTCAYCTGKINEGKTYVRRPVHDGARFTTQRLHPECEDALIEELTKAKAQQ